MRTTPSMTTAPHAQVAAPSPRAWALLLLLGTIWGGSFLFIALALRGWPPFTLVAFRVLLGALSLWGFILWRGLPLPRLSLRLLGTWAVMGLLNNAIPFSLIVWGQTQIESGLASILNAMTAVFGVLLAALLLSDERMSGAKLVGTLLGLIGVAVIIGTQSLGQLDPRQLGQWAVLGATLSYALATVWGRVALKGQMPLFNAAGMLAGSALIMIPLALLVDGAPNISPPLEAVLALLALGIGATALAYLLYFRIMAEAGAANTMLVTLIVPPFAVLLGWLVLGETLSLDDLAGFALIAAGLLVIDGRVLGALRAAI
ncbi:MAG: DMT family transporter [Neomegalonema sp.]|nr:DMT family transporter [Neomegalonema sp.]